MKPEKKNRINRAKKLANGGMTNAEIGELLGVRAKTVGSYLVQKIITPTEKSHKCAKCENSVDVTYLFKKKYLCENCFIDRDVVDLSHSIEWESKKNTSDASIF